MPVIEAVYNALYDHGCREFCFIVSDDKSSIQDYFCADHPAGELAGDHLLDLYERIRSTRITYVQQPSPRGFGDAILKAKDFVGGDVFLVHAADDVVLSAGSSHIRRLEDAFLANDADIAFLVDRVENPEMYGVVEGESIGRGLLMVNHLEEKPRRPRTNLAVVATYILKPSIFFELERTKPDRYGEIELSNAIEPMLARNKCIAVELEANERRMDVGTPEGYVACVADSFEISRNSCRGTYA